MHRKGRAYQQKSPKYLPKQPLNEAPLSPATSNAASAPVNCNNLYEKKSKQRVRLTAYDNEHMCRMCSSAELLKFTVV